MDRRDMVLALIALGLAPLSSVAQQPGKVWRVGFLAARRRPDSFESDRIGAFQRGMRELGYIEGKNLIIEWRFADNKFERLPGLAAELVALKVDVIVGAGTPDVRAAQKATSEIPIVMATVGDPVGSGFAKSLARPEANITGLSVMSGDISPKLLELLLTVTPDLSRVAILVNPTNPAYIATLKSVQATAKSAGVHTLTVEVRSAEDIEKAFPMVIRDGAGSIIVQPESLFIQRLHQIAELAVKNRLPSIMTFLGYAEAGGLMSYGPDFTESYRRAATYVDKILKGAKPGELPIEQPTKFELVINLKTAKALGLKIPQSVLLRADRVIE